MHKFVNECDDFCDGIALTNAVTGEKEPTQLFVSALGASSYTFARVDRNAYRGGIRPLLRELARVIKEQETPACISSGFDP